MIKWSLILVILKKTNFETSLSSIFLGPLPYPFGISISGIFS
ncbi:hypothetical protein X975_25962, partial [Stegodyphus mimosarum]